MLGAFLNFIRNLMGTCMTAFVKLILVVLILVTKQTWVKDFPKVKFKHLKSERIVWLNYKAWRKVVMLMTS